MRMGWFNCYGLAIMAIIMLPNIAYAIKSNKGKESKPQNKALEIAEQIGRYACFALMIFNIPYTYFNFWFSHALIVYVAVNGALCLAYLVFWLICWDDNTMLRAITLSVFPSCVFLFSGIVLAYIPLIAFAVLFGSTHIYISVKNAEHLCKKKRKKQSRKEKLADIVITLFVLLLFALAVVGTVFDF